MSEKHGVLAYGRMNPPTAGHEQVVNKVHEVAKKHNAEHKVVLSHSQDSKKNPLSVDQKVKHAKNAFPGTNIHGASKEKPTILHHAADMHKAGVNHLHVVAGSDRTDEYHKLLHKYNGQQSAHGHYNFKSITVHSSGERDPDSEGTTGVSATKMREHAAAGREKEFHAGLPSKMKPEHKKALYHDVRKGLDINEETVLEDFETAQKHKARAEKAKAKGRMGLYARFMAAHDQALQEEGKAPTAPAPIIHRIGVTVTDPDHPMVTKRKEQQLKFVRVHHHNNDKEQAIARGKKHFERKGFKVHDAHHAGTVYEESVQIDEISSLALQKYRAGAQEKLLKQKVAGVQDKSTTQGLKVSGEKLKKKMSEEVALEESHVEFRLDHREKTSGDVNSTLKDHEAKVSDQTDKATYIKVPKHKADSFKSAMKSKHGAKVELDEEVEAIDEMTQGKSYTQKQLSDKIKTGNWEAQTDIKPGKHVEMRHHTGKRVMVHCKEEAIDEVLSKTATAGEWIKDFIDSDNPKFAGKSKEKRKQMALAAYYAKQRNEGSDHDPYYEAQEHKASAEKAKKEGDNKSYHLFMAAHHDSMANWSSNRGRHHVADQHMNKAEQHQDWAMKEEVQIDEATPAKGTDVSDKKWLKDAGKKPGPLKNVGKGFKAFITGKPEPMESVEVSGEQLDEANHREFASQGKMHPDMAKHMTVGQHTDYYEPKTGDKVHGKVVHKSDSEVHVRQTHDSYDPKKVGTLHKFSVSDKLEEAKKVAAPVNVDKVNAAGQEPHEEKWEKAKKVAKSVKEETITEASYKGDGKVETKKYSWGTMKTVHHGSDFSIPLHPEHHQAIAKLKDEQEHKFKDETGRHWVARRKGEHVHFDTTGNGSMKTKVPHSTMKEETNMKTFTEMKDYLMEYTPGEGGVTKVKGRSYGAQYHDPEGDDDADDKPKTQPAGEKRGRGRPKGSSSGARQKGSTAAKKSGGVEYTGFKLHLPTRN